MKCSIVALAPLAVAAALLVAAAPAASASTPKVKVTITTPTHATSHGHSAQSDIALVSAAATISGPAKITGLWVVAYAKGFGQYTQGTVAQLYPGRYTLVTKVKYRTYTTVTHHTTVLHGALHNSVMAQCVVQPATDVNTGLWGLCRSPVYPLQTVPVYYETPPGAVVGGTFTAEAYFQTEFAKVDKVTTSRVYGATKEYVSSPRKILVTDGRKHK